MSEQQIQSHRDLYERLRAQIAAPGDTYWRGGECLRRRFVNKDNMTWDELMSCPDTPYIARSLATRKAGMLCAIGVY